MAKVEKGKSTTAQRGESQLFATPTGLDLKPFKTIRIAVSGDVSLNKLETRIIDTPSFQRLRGIKELGTTYIVYPTAVHTRFDHSLGTLSMATEMIRYIRENKHNLEDERKIDQEQEQLIRLLGLLHDIGHIPFGHTLEDEFCIFERHDKDPERTEYFLGDDTPIGKEIIRTLGKEMYQRFMRIFNANKNTFLQLGEDLFIYDIVNNTVCADLLDYLRRDCYFCNLVMDTDYRFLKYLYLCNDSVNGVTVRRVAVRLWKTKKPSPRRDILSGLIRLLDNRYLLGERVYYHHAKLISGSMLAAAVQRAKLKKKDMYELSDEGLIAKLGESKNKSVIKLVNYFKHRILWKHVYEKDRHTVTAEQQQARDVSVEEQIKGLWTNVAERTHREDVTAAHLGMNSGDFLIHCPELKMAMKLAEMKVFWNGQLKPLADCDDDPIVARKLKVILDSHENLWAIRVFINPDFIDKQESIQRACEYLFDFVPRNITRNEKQYFNMVVDGFVESENLSRDLLYKDCKEKKDKAVKTLISATDAIRDKSTVMKIVKDAFTK